MPRVPRFSGNSLSASFPSRSCARRAPETISRVPADAAIPRDDAVVLEVRHAPLEGFHDLRVRLVHHARATASRIGRANGAGLPRYRRRWLDSSCHDSIGGACTITPPRPEHKGHIAMPVHATASGLGGGGPSVLATCVTARNAMSAANPQVPAVRFARARQGRSRRHLRGTAARPRARASDVPTGRARIARSRRAQAGRSGNNARQEIEEPMTHDERAHHAGRTPVLPYPAISAAANESPRRPP